MSKAMKRAALYVRVSTDHQSVENQIRELRQVAERRGWQVARVSAAPRGEINGPAQRPIQLYLVCSGLCLLRSH
jgi:DNA invertase Pin-like site-specific DNA recombinase